MLLFYNWLQEKKRKKKIFFKKFDWTDNGGQAAQKELTGKQPFLPLGSAQHPPAQHFMAPGHSLSSMQSSHISWSEEPPSDIGQYPSLGVAMDLAKIRFSKIPTYCELIKPLAAMCRLKSNTTDDSLLQRNVST